MIARLVYYPCQSVGVLRWHIIQLVYKIQGVPSTYIYKYMYKYSFVSIYFFLSVSCPSVTGRLLRGCCLCGGEMNVVFVVGRKQSPKDA